MTDSNENGEWCLEYDGIEIYGDYGSIYSYHCNNSNKYGAESYEVAVGYINKYFTQITYKFIPKDIIELIISYHAANIEYEAYWMGRSIGAYPFKELYETYDKRTNTHHPTSHTLLPFGNKKFNSLNDLDGKVFKDINGKLFRQYKPFNEYKWLGVTSLLLSHHDMGDNGLSERIGVHLGYNEEDVRYQIQNVQYLLDGYC